MSDNTVNLITKNLKIFHINVNSLILISRRYTLNEFIKTHKPDIVLLNETKLNRKHKLEFDQYNIIRRDRPNSKRSGGTAILIKTHIKHKPYTNIATKSFKFLETTIVKIPMNDNKMLYIVSAYYPSGNNDSHFKLEIRQLFESINLQNLDNYYILAGDLNSKRVEWGNKDNNTKGNILFDWLAEYEILFRCKFYASLKPSYPRSDSFIDVCISDSRIDIKSENNTLNCVKTWDYDSDHNALEIVASMHDERQPFILFKQTPNIKYNFKATNWNTFKSKILVKTNNEHIVPNNCNLHNDEIESYLTTINTLINSVIEEVVPKYKEKKYTMDANHIIRKLHSEKSKLLTIVKRHNRLEICMPPNRLMYLKSVLKRIKKLIDDNFSLAINDNFKSRISNIKSKHSLEMFDKVRKNFRKFDSINLDTLKIPSNLLHIIHNAGLDERTVERDSNQNFVINDEDQVVNIIGSYFESVHSSKEIDANNITHTHVNQTFNAFLEAKTSFERNRTTLTMFTETKRANSLNDTETGNFFVTHDTIKYIFQNLRKKTSSGLDNIPNVVLKNIPEIMILDYCTLFNNMINNSYYPRDWKKAKVVVVPKKDKDSSKPENLRPISLLPNISKVFEMCVNNTLSKLCLLNNLTNDKQFGFKHKHSTINAINKLVSDINWNWNRKLCTGACLIDMEKAFDSIWIQGLICKFIDYKFPLNLVILLFNMINGKSFTVHHKNRVSKTYKIANGLQQGTVNAPVLFNIYILDLIDSIENIISFADDIIIYQEGDKIININRNLQSTFDIVETYCSNWHMKINIQKCETILFRPTVDKCNYNIKTNWKSFAVKSRLSNIIIPNRDSVKYLGIYLDKFLYYDKHVVYAINKARRAFFAFKNLFYSKYLERRVKIIMYQLLIRPIITYGCSIWFNISPSYMEKIRVFERKCLRACTSVNRSYESNYQKYVSNLKLYNAANVSRIDNFIIKLIRNHILRCIQCTDFNLIMAPYYTDQEYIKTSIRNGFVPPESFLFLDGENAIQNVNGVPIFYHLYRRANVKAIDYNRSDLNNLRFDTIVPQKDKDIALSADKIKYWWLQPQ